MNNILKRYLILCLISLILNKISNYILNFDQLLHNSLSEQLTSKQIENFFELQKKWNWINYPIIFLFLIIKTSIVSTIIYIGLFLSNKDLKFSTILNSVLKAEYIFLLVPVFKIIWFYFLQTNYTFEDVQYFYPLSALNLIGYKNLETWFIYPFQTLNLFELFYVIYLGFQVGKLTNTNADYGLKIVGLSYVPSLLLWVTTIMFFTLNYS